MPITDRQRYRFSYVTSDYMRESMSQEAYEDYVTHMQDEALWKMGHEIAKLLIETEHGCVVRIDEHKELQQDRFNPYVPEERHDFSIFVNPVRTMEYTVPVFNAPDWRTAMGPQEREPSNPAEIRCQHCGQLNMFSELECRKCGAPLYKNEEYWE